VKKLHLDKGDVSLSEALRQMGDQPLAILQKGRPIAVLSPSAGADLETLSLNFSPKFQDILEESRRSFYTHGGIPLEDVMRELAAEDAAKKGPAKKPAKRKRRSLPQQPTQE
jgi:hypothetical protein